MADEFRQYLESLGYRVVKLFQQQQNTAVFIVEYVKNNKSDAYVAKCAKRVECVTFDEIAILNNEIKALKFVKGIPGAAKIVKVLPMRNNIKGFLEEYYMSTKLSDFTSLNPVQWYVVLKGILNFVEAMERKKLLHNDLWDSNILCLIGETEGIAVVDFQYCHYYGANNNPKAPNAIFGDAKEMKRLGWSRRWHTGGDLNQILGLVRERMRADGAFLELCDYIDKHVVYNPDADFPYVTTRSNRYFSVSKIRRLLEKGKMN